MIITGDKAEIKSLKAKLFQEFEIKDRLILSRDRGT